jgi:hypothetical protein
MGLKLTAPFLILAIHEFAFEGFQCNEDYTIDEFDNFRVALRDSIPVIPFEGGIINDENYFHIVSFIKEWVKSSQLLLIKQEAITRFKTFGISMKDFINS